MFTKQNITFGIIGNYCYFPDVVVEGSQVSNYSISAAATEALDPYSYYVYFSDLAAVVSIDLANRLEVIPNTFINYKRFSDCGGYWPTVQNDFGGATGGFASSIMMEDIYDKNPDIVGVIGLEYSSTARGPAEILSLKQIPYCSGCSQSPRLSNKNLFPYFWRPLPGLGMGDHIFQLFASWNVKRVAVIYQKDDDMGTQFGLDIIASLRRRGILVVATIALRSSITDNVLAYTRTALTRVDARYIILSGQANFGLDVYQGVGLVDERTSG
ncbi:periplasmic binding protein-like I [Obelidium mucronatum]|nr:periplasmic binding protein-like I [Obelidium mucronatum]